MKSTRTDWIPFAVLSVFALVGVTFAFRGEFAFSAVFALFFLGYTMIRVKYIARKPLPGWSQQVPFLGYILVLAGVVIFAVAVIAQRR